MIKLVLVLYVIVALLSCNKVIDAKSDSNIDNTAMYSDDLSATAALNDVYTEIMKAPSVLNGFGTKFPGMYGDEIIRPFASTAADNYFLNNQLLSNNTTIIEIWNTIYYHIYITNTTIENVAISKNVTPQTKKQLEGEARFLRALNYFYLVNYFGGVPLVLSTNTNITKNLKRAPQEEVYAQIKTDLLEAIQLLPVTYPGKNESPANRIRANKGAAAALLARVYLYLKDYPNAITQSSWVINCGAYRLKSNLNDVFLPQSNETILGLLPTNGSYNTYEGKIFNVNSTTPPYVLTDNLVKSFDSKDARATQWMRSVSTGSGTVKVPYKYKVYESNQVLEYNVILRLAEMYLIRAEANAFLGNAKESISDLNIIRDRAGVDRLEETLGAGALKFAIETENQHEFFAELGHRYLDLKRWPSNNNNTLFDKNTRADDVIRLNKVSWEPYKSYWPIPRDEGLVQNPGYSN